MLRPHRGATILAFGILGFLVCQLFGVAAWVMADNDLREMDRGYMDPSGRDLTRTGRILGWSQALCWPSRSSSFCCSSCLQASHIDDQSCRNALTGSIRAARPAG